MDADLATPRRTSPLGAVVDVVSPERLRDLAPLVIVAISLGRVALVVGVGLVVSLIIGVLRWWRRTWSFDGAVLHLDEGVLVRGQRRIPVQRIQHVELERRLRHQVFGLAAVRVETAGGSGAELRLDSITQTEAEALRSRLLGARDVAVAGERADEAGVAVPQDWDVARHGPPPPPPPPPPVPTEVLIHLPPGRLLLAGITGPEVIAVLASLAFFLDALVDFGIDPDDLAAADLGRLSLALVLAVGIPAWLALAGVIGLVRRWDLTAVVQGDELRVTYGLLRRNELVLPTDRIKDARVSHRFLLRPFGRADLRLRSAASGRGDASRVDIPLLGPDEIDRVLTRVLPAAVPRPVLAPAPPAARQRCWVRGGIGSLVVVIALAVLAARSSPALLGAAVVVLPAGPLLGELAWRGLGWAAEDGVHHSRVGALTRRTAIVPIPRVQSSSVVATWLQRRRRLGSVRVDLAGASVGVVDRDLEECRAIARALVDG